MVGFWDRKLIFWTSFLFFPLINITSSETHEMVPGIVLQELFFKRLILHLHWNHSAPNRGNKTDAIFESSRLFCSMVSCHSWLSTPPIRKHPSCLTKQFAGTLPVCLSHAVEVSPALQRVL